MNDRGISPVLGYVLTLGIVTLLISGLFIGAGGFVENQNDRAIRSELNVIGNRLAADIAAVDRLALATGASGEASLRTDLPLRTAGQAYEISITDLDGSDSVHVINMTVLELEIEVKVQVKTETDLVNTTISGGNVLIEYDGMDLEVKDV